MSPHLLPFKHSFTVVSNLFVQSLLGLCKDGQHITYYSTIMKIPQVLTVLALLVADYYSVVSAVECELIAPEAPIEEALAEVSGLSFRGFSPKITRVPGDPMLKILRYSSEPMLEVVDGKLVVSSSTCASPPTGTAPPFLVHGQPRWPWLSLEPCRLLVGFPPPLCWPLDTWLLDQMVCRPKKKKITANR